MPEIPLLAAATKEDAEHNPKLEEHHRTLTLKEVEVDTSPEGRDGAIGDRPSIGAAPPSSSTLGPPLAVEDHPNLPYFMNLAACSATLKQKAGNAAVADLDS